LAFEVELIECDNFGGEVYALGGDIGISMCFFSELLDQGGLANIYDGKKLTWISNEDKLEKIMIIIAHFKKNMLFYKWNLLYYFNLMVDPQIMDTIAIMQIKNCIKL
jgi:hypothetical protein